jgi:light-regulated signal transduction histidine kinase (bacteriophytochrome)
MQRLIRDLLAYSRVGTNKIDLSRVSSQKALDAALANLGGAVADSGAIVTSDRLPSVYADKMQLVQLFQNLVGNGIKYNRQDVPRVHVSAQRDGPGNWAFSIKDNGLGIEPEYFERIFGMFQRLHTRDQFSGTGIGLAICKKIVDRHGGSISVASGPAGGSTFSFSICDQPNEGIAHDD